jgi:hypothetical protein
MAVVDSTAIFDGRISMERAASQAGTNASCACGQIVSIPSLSDLQNRFQIKKTSGDQEVGPVRWAWPISIIGVVVLLFAVWFWQLSPLAIYLGLVMFLSGKFWFLAVMFREMGGTAFLVFIIPFFDWLFQLKWKILHHLLRHRLP